jgi:NADH-quinone oxidoreductase subunit K
VIHLAGPVVLAAVLAGAGVYGLVSRRNAVLVLIGAELLLNAVNVLLVTASTLPPGGLTALAAGSAGSAPADPMIPGQVLPIVVITIAAAEIGLALAVILLVFRERGTSDLSALRELGEASPSYDEAPDAGELPEPGPASPAELPSPLDPVSMAGTAPAGERTS